MLGVSDASGGVAGIPTGAATDKRRRMDSELQKLIDSAQEFLDENEEGEDDEEKEDEDEDDDATTEDGTTGDTTTEDATTTSSSDDRSGNYHMEFRQHKQEYYIHKMGYTKVSGGPFQADCLECTERTTC